VTVGLRRFASRESGELETLRMGSWRSIEIPTDAAPEPWRMVVDAPLRACLPS
jgi:hypothetical protein